MSEIVHHHFSLMFVVKIRILILFDEFHIVLYLNGLYVLNLPQMSKYGQGLAFKKLVLNPLNMLVPVQSKLCQW